MRRTTMTKRILALAFLIALPTFGATESSSTAKGSFRHESPINFGFDFQYSGLRFLGFPVERVATGQVYDGFSHGARVGLEWLPLHFFGRLGLGVGFTVVGAKDISLGGGKYTSLIGIPLDASINYRAAFSPRQWVVPFAKFGATVIGIKQTSKTGGPDQKTQLETNLNYGMG